VEPDSAPAVLRALRKVREVRPAVPPMTYRLDRGLAAAESPRGRLSFGQHRSALLARATLAALGARQRLGLEHIAAAFAREKIDANTPWKHSLDFDLLG
jgi:hypothetical protein